MHILIIIILVYWKIGKSFLNFFVLNYLKYLQNSSDSDVLVVNIDGKVYVRDSTNGNDYRILPTNSEGDFVCFDVGSDDSNVKSKSFITNFNRSFLTETVPNWPRPPKSIRTNSTRSMENTVNSYRSEYLKFKYLNCQLFRWTGHVFSLNSQFMKIRRLVRYGHITAGWQHLRGCTRDIGSLGSDRLARDDGYCWPIRPGTYRLCLATALGPGQASTSDQRTHDAAWRCPAPLGVHTRVGGPLPGPAI